VEVDVMSVLVIGKFPGDTAAFTKVMGERTDELVSLAAEARAAGAIHHRFGVGDGFVVIVDEWERPEQFQQFFAREDIQALVAEMGASGSPEITISEAISSPDQF
jgi:hypothetical protein